MQSKRNDEVAEIQTHGISYDCRLSPGEISGIQLAFRTSRFQTSMGQRQTQVNRGEQKDLKGHTQQAKGCRSRCLCDAPPLLSPRCPACCLAHRGSLVLGPLSRGPLRSGGALAAFLPQPRRRVGVRHAGQHARTHAEQRRREPSADGASNTRSTLRNVGWPTTSISRFQRLLSRARSAIGACKGRRTTDKNCSCF